VRTALGATPANIRALVIGEGGRLALAGIVLGLAAGEFLKFLLRFSTTVPLWSAAVATLVSIMVGVIFGIVPANRAARLDPVEALRYE